MAPADILILDGLIVSELDIFPNTSLHRSNRKLVEIIMTVLKALSERDSESRYCNGSRQYHKTVRVQKGLLPIVCNGVSFLVVT
jgi:hypothetical protein